MIRPRAQNRTTCQFLVAFVVVVLVWGGTGMWDVLLHIPRIALSAVLVEKSDSLFSLLFQPKPQYPQF